MDLNNRYFQNVLYEDLNHGKRSRNIVMDDLTRVPEEIIKSDYSFIDFFDGFCKGTIIDTEKPKIISTAYGNIKQFENIRYDSDTISHLNSNGLDIYLFEVIHFKNNDKKYYVTDNEKYDRNHTLSNHKISVIGFENDEIEKHKLIVCEFESIREFISNNNLTNVKVYCVDYGIKALIQDRYDFEIDTLDIYLISLNRQSSDHDFNSFDFYPIDANSDDIIKKFWCGNRRYTAYREILISKLKNKNSFLSFDRSNQDYGIFENYCWSEKIKSFDVSDTKDISKLTMDLDFESQQGWFDIWTSPVPQKYYKSCFCAIVTETRFAHPTGIISEKTINAIKCLRPFVLVAPPHTLKYLKNYGFETFSDLWDESYDLETQHWKRLDKILKLIDQIDSYTTSDMKTIYQSIYDRLKRNQSVIKQIGRDLK